MHFFYSQIILLQNGFVGFELNDLNYIIKELSKNEIILNIQGRLVILHNTLHFYNPL